MALVTEEFWGQGHFVASSAGMPDVPRIELPHPVAGTGEAAMRKVAEELAGSMVAALRGTA